MNIIDRSIFNEKQTTGIEDHYNAKYVCTTSLKNKRGGWANFPAAVFYTEEAHPEGSNYFGLYFMPDDTMMISNAISATEPFEGLRLGDTVVFSRYRHDYYTHEGGMMVDGGRDYMKCFIPEGSEIVTLQIKKDKLEVIN